jgi:hypothetical protein
LAFRIYLADHYFICHLKNGMEQDLFFDQEKGKIAINSMIYNKFRYPPNAYYDI